MAKNMKSQPFILDERSRNRLDYLAAFFETNRSATVRRLIREGYDRATEHTEGTPHAEIKKPPKSSQPSPSPVPTNKTKIEPSRQKTP